MTPKKEELLEKSEKIHEFYDLKLKDVHLIAEYGLQRNVNSDSIFKIQEGLSLQRPPVPEVDIIIREIQPLLYSSIIAAGRIADPVFIPFLEKLLGTPADYGRMKLAVRTAIARINTVINLGYPNTKSEGINFIKCFINELNTSVEEIKSQINLSVYGNQHDPDCGEIVVLGKYVLYEISDIIYTEKNGFLNSSAYALGLPLEVYALTDIKSSIFSLSSEEKIIEIVHRIYNSNTYKEYPTTPYKISLLKILLDEIISSEGNMLIFIREWREKALISSHYYRSFRLDYFEEFMMAEKSEYMQGKMKKALYIIMDQPLQNNGDEVWRHLMLSLIERMKIKHKWKMPNSNMTL